MDIRMSINSETGKVAISAGPQKTRKEDLNKWLGRNDDAVLVKLSGTPDPSFRCCVGHLCRIEECDDSTYCVFVGKHLIGQLPDEAIAFADRIGSSPDCLVAIVGKLEDSAVLIYIAE